MCMFGFCGGGGGAAAGGGLCCCCWRSKEDSEDERITRAEETEARARRQIRRLEQLYSRRDAMAQDYSASTLAPPIATIANEQDL